VVTSVRTSDARLGLATAASPTEATVFAPEDDVSPLFRYPRISCVEVDETSEEEEECPLVKAEYELGGSAEEIGSASSSSNRKPIVPKEASEESQNNKHCRKNESGKKEIQRRRMRQLGKRDMLHGVPTAARQKERREQKIKKDRGKQRPGGERRGTCGRRKEEEKRSGEKNSAISTALGRSKSREHGDTENMAVSDGDSETTDGRFQLEERW
jgi:hypothetical protein